MATFRKESTTPLRAGDLFSAAGNEGPQSGYLSKFRPVSGTVSGVGTGTFMNFNPGSGAANFLLPISTGFNDVNIIMEYDQPYRGKRWLGRLPRSHRMSISMY